MTIFYMDQNRCAYPAENATEFVSRSEANEPCEKWTSTIIASRAETIEPCEKNVHHYCQSIGRQLSRSTGTTVEMLR